MLSAGVSKISQLFFCCKNPEPEKEPSLNKRYFSQLDVGSRFVAKSEFEKKVTVNLHSQIQLPSRLFYLDFVFNKVIIDPDDLNLINSFVRQFSNEIFYDFPQEISLENLKDLEKIHQLAFENKDTKLLQIIKRYKIKLLQKMETYLNGIKKKKFIPIKPEETHQKRKLSIYDKAKIFFNKLGCVLTIVSNLCFNSVFNYFGIYSMLMAIPNIYVPLCIALSVIVVIIQFSISLPFQKSLVEKYFQTKFIVDKEAQTLDQETFELEILQRINESLKYHEVVIHSVFNTDTRDIFDHALQEIIKNKNKNFSKPKVEKLNMKILRHFLTTVGIVVMISQVYLGMTGLMTMMAPFLVGTPVGWLLTGLNLFANIAIYLTFRSIGEENMNEKLLKYNKVVDLTKALRNSYEPAKKTIYNSIEI